MAELEILSIVSPSSISAYSYLSGLPMDALVEIITSCRPPDILSIRKVCQHPPVSCRYPNFFADLQIPIRSYPPQDDMDGCGSSDLFPTGRRCCHFPRGRLVCDPVGTCCNCPLAYKELVHDAW